MKKTTLLLLTVISVALMGCKEDKSPTKTAIKSSLQLLNENRISEFRSSLIGNASKQMASDRAVEALKQKVSQLGQTDLGNENVLSSSTTPQGSSIVVSRVDVKANNNIVGTVDVTCRTDYSSTNEYYCEPDRPVYDGGHDYGGRDSNNPPRYDGRNDDHGSSDRDHNHDGGYIVPGDSHDKPDPNDNRDPNRPPRFPGMIGFSYSSQNQWGRCYTRTHTSSSTDCKVSQINL